MRFRRDEPSPRMVTLDFTSMVDLVFLLVIFFLTTSTFIEKNKSRVDLPDDDTIRRDELRTIDRSSLVVNVTRNGTIVVSQEYLSTDALFEKVGAELARLGGDASRLDVLIRADQSAPLVFVNEIATRLIALGVDRWKLGMELSPGAAAQGDAP